MPRLPINYQNTYFYKIVCKDLSVPDSYVGHTTDFTKRRADHKKRSNNLTSTALPVHRFIHNNGGWDNFDMILIERRTCQDKLEACKFERGHIEDLNATLNAHMPSRTKKEYYEEKREHTLKKVKEYYESNKEKVDEWRNTRFECECGGSFFNHNKARHDRTLKHQEYLASTSD
jgi:predicted GIY-YIG superfamily endonuclease